ncbi:hypothetical protein KC321_g79 [Hortaea werneckii]|nr:hypothetical protein KC321_g79 [Hortaea werneckii]
MVYSILLSPIQSRTSCFGHDTQSSHLLTREYGLDEVVALLHTVKYRLGLSYCSTAAGIPGRVERRKCLDTVRQSEPRYTGRSPHGGEWLTLCYLSTSLTILLNNNGCAAGSAEAGCPMSFDFAPSRTSNIGSEEHSTIVRSFDRSPLLNDPAMERARMSVPASYSSGYLSKISGSSFRARSLLPKSADAVAAGSDLPGTPETHGRALALRVWSVVGIALQCARELVPGPTHVHNPTVVRPSARAQRGRSRQRKQ